MDERLVAVAASQARWSATANRLGRRYRGTRWTTLAFAIAGALAAAIASQVENPFRLVLAAGSACLFAVVTLITSRFLGGTEASARTRARAASEALKREAYRYAAQAAPYDGSGDSGRLLRQEADRIEKDVDDLLGLQVDAEPGSLPTDRIGPADYIARRVRHQIDEFFLPRAKGYQAEARTLRWTEFGLALLTTILTALMAVTGKNPIAGVRFDFVALTAVLTTVSGAILAHVEASQFDFVVTSYRATARRLQSALSDAPSPAVAPSPAWSAFVQQCEDILQQENSSWVSKFSKPATPAGR